jgi:hypothetical protein
MRRNCCGTQHFRLVKKIYGIRLIWKWTAGKDFVTTEQQKSTMGIKFQ